MDLPDVQPKKKSLFPNVMHGQSLRSHSAVPSRGPAAHHILQQRSLAAATDSDDDKVEVMDVKTTIICTIGPNTASVGMLRKLVDAGMSVARLNFSHGDHEYHGKVIQNLRTALKLSEEGSENDDGEGTPSRLCAIMLDTKGPEIRTGKLANGVSSVTLTKGNDFIWHHDLDKRNEGNENEMFCTYADLATTVKPGSKILCSDALLSFTVKKCDPDNKQVFCRIDNTGPLGNTKNMNFPNAVTKLPALTEKDYNDILFGVEQNIDIIAASFIRKPSDVAEIRAVPGVAEKHIAIIAKIENQEGLDNFDAILEVVDGVMVARGDLGSEIPIENVAGAQKMMISKCNLAGKPVITATQMLDSMIKNPRPTRAEATDVANAVLDGTDSVMLSGETASGDYPIQAVQTMARICRAAESSIDHRDYFMRVRRKMKPPIPLPESMASSAVKTAWDLRAPLIIVVTETGKTARLVSKYRPHTPILTITRRAKTARTCILSRGTIPFLAEAVTGTDELTEHAIATAKSANLIKAGDRVPVIFGHLEGVSGSINAMLVSDVK